MTGSTQVTPPADSAVGQVNRVLYRRQLSPLLAALPVLLWQGRDLPLAALWLFVTFLLVAAMLAAYREWLPVAALPVLMLATLGLQVSVRLCAGQGLDATTAAGLLLMVMVALSCRTSLGLAVIGAWMLLLLTLPWLQPTLPWEGLLAINLLMLGVAWLVLLASLRIRRWLLNAEWQQRQLQDQLRQAEAALCDSREQCVRMRRRLEQGFAERTTQLQSTNCELLEANARLENFSYMASHDMRASLRIMDGFAKLLADEVDRSGSMTMRQNLGRIKTAIRHMHGMLVELLKLANNGPATIERDTVDLSTLVTELTDDLQMLEPERCVEVRVAADVYAQAEPELTREVLQNLLGNAWKFTARRQRACIEFGVLDEASGRAYYVRDNGVGFDMHRVAELFKPFSRLHTVQEFEGTGLGLLAVRRIVERHGGRVWAVGSPEAGAQFYFTLGEAGQQQAQARSANACC